MHQLTLSLRCNHWKYKTAVIPSNGVPRGRLGGFKAPLNLQKNVYCVFAKYTLQALLLCSLNQKFYTPGVQNFVAIGLRVSAPQIRDFAKPLFGFWVLQ